MTGRCLRTSPRGAGCAPQAASGWPSACASSATPVLPAAGGPRARSVTDPPKRPWNGSWNEGTAAASAFRALWSLRWYVSAGRARGAASRASCKRQAAGSNPATGSQVSPGLLCWQKSGPERSSRQYALAADARSVTESDYPAKPGALAWPGSALKVSRWCAAPPGERRKLAGWQACGRPRAGYPGKATAAPAVAYSDPLAILVMLIGRCAC